MILRNSPSLISPSPSRSASSIISCSSSSGDRRVKSQTNYTRLKKIGDHALYCDLGDEIRFNFGNTLPSNQSLGTTHSLLQFANLPVRFSPNSLATRFKFLKEIFPVSSSSNNLNAFKISSLESFSVWERKGSEYN